MNQAILKGMALEAQDRPQSVQEWLQLLVPNVLSGEDDLSSDVGTDYSRLRDLLAQGKWKEADRETLLVMLKAANREQEGYLDTKSLKGFPCTDLRTIDQLWVKYSNGRFGFSVQKAIWKSVGGKPGEYDYKILKKLGDRVGWLKWENKWLGLKKEELWLIYREITFHLNAPQGHLPKKVSAVKGGDSWQEYKKFSSLASRLVNCNI